MNIDEIKKQWPAFEEWLHKKKGYATAGGFYLIALWYEFLKEQKKGSKSAGGILSLVRTLAMPFLASATAFLSDLVGVLT